MMSIRSLYSALALCIVATTRAAEQPSALFVALGQLDAPQHYDRQVTTTGTVVETFRDEVDPAWHFLVLKDRDAFLPVGVSARPDVNPNDWLDAEISVTGVLHERNGGARLFAGPYLNVDEPSTNSIRVIRPPDDADTCEPLDLSQWVAPKDVVCLGRRTACGVVLARWDGKRFALRTPQADTVIVKLRGDETPPPPGLRVCAVGYPETDLYRLSLTRAVCREQPDAGAPPPDRPLRIVPEQLFLDDEGRLQLHYPIYHGRLVSLSGVVRRIDTSGNGLHVDLEGGRHVLSVDIDPAASPELAGLEPDAKVEVTGVCLMECETWNPNLVLPRIKSCRLFVREASDVRILSRPPWWTPTRLLFVIGLLLVGIVGFAAWSAALRKIVHRRSRELLKEQIAHVSANLRTDERTRLAVELHDALSQNLEGVAFQVAASRDLMAVSPDTARASLDAAGRMLLSSRTELKRCLFDLRHDALEARCFDEALRTTLEPISGDAELVIRFNVRRDIFTDTTAHIVLCIIRELVSNAVRHGKARGVRIAGEYHDGTLSFSVRDDGCGFDADRSPGPDEGHFGLEGIRERVRRLNGVFLIESQPGGPTRAVVTAILGPQSVTPTASQR